jgi:LMBR1 domain-containing protein 1
MLSITNQIQQDEDNKKKSLWKYISWALKLLTPFRVVIGIVCLSLSLLVIYSLLINNIDRLMNSECGYKCGFMLDKSP